MKNLKEYYEKQLKKVKTAFPVNSINSEIVNERNREYIETAEMHLRSVVNGRKW